MARTIEVASNAAASAWTDITNKVAWAGMMLGGVAHQGEIGTGAGFNLDDDAGAVTLPAKRVFRVIEDATSPDTVLQRGRISDKTVSRKAIFTGDARAFDTSVDDANAELRGIVVDGWSRPAETDYARIQALASAFLSGSPRASTDLDCTTYVPNTHTVTMPKKTYEQTDPAGVIDDCRTTAGKQAFVTEDGELFYDLDTSTAFAADLSITDDGADEVASFFPEEPSASQQGNEFFSGAKIAYQGGSVSDTRTGAESAHDYWHTALFDGDADATTAAQRLATMLDNQSVEELRYTCALTLANDQVDLIKKGQTVSFRAAAAAVLTPVTLRVASLYWEPVGPTTYRVHLELGTPQKLAGRVRHNRPIVPNDDEWVCIPPDLSVPWLLTTGAEGGFCVIPAGELLCRTDTTPGSSGLTCTLYVGATYQVRYTVFHPPGSNDLSAFLNDGVLSVVGAADTGADCEDRHDAAVLSVVEFTWPSSGPHPVYSDTVYAVLSGDFYLPCPVEFAELGARIDYVSGPDPRFESLGACTNGAPRVGQRVRQASFLGDGTTTAFMTDFPFTDGTLRIMVNGLDWTPEIATTDLTTGDFTMNYPFPLGADVDIRYRRGS